MAPSTVFPSTGTSSQPPTRPSPCAEAHVPPVSHEAPCSPVTQRAGPRSSKKRIRLARDSWRAALANEKGKRRGLGESCGTPAQEAESRWGRGAERTGLRTAVPRTRVTQQDGPVLPSPCTQPSPEASWGKRGWEVGVLCHLCFLRQGV